MIVYELFLSNCIDGYDIIGILPERRRKPERITQESVLNWGKKILGSNANEKRIYFVRKILPDF
jgi:hypothetical protein